MTYSQNASEGPLPCAVSTKDALRAPLLPTAIFSSPQELLRKQNT